MRNATRVWINGANGQVGRAILSELDKTEKEYEVLETDKDVDVTDLKEVTSFCDINYPDIIIHCAATHTMYNDNYNIENIYKVNTLGARNAAIAARRINAKIIYLSTDDVFDGLLEHSLNEFDMPNPKSVYGKSKFAGEQFIKELCDKHLIVRSSWIYGKSENNFVYNLLLKARSGETIYVNENEFSTPTSAKALAKFVVKLLDTTEYGIYHASCEGRCSRFEFAQEIMKYNNIDCVFVTQKLDKPINTVLDNLMMRMTNIYKMPNWKDALKSFFDDEGGF